MSERKANDIDCARVRALLSPLLDGELEARLAGVVKAHLAACASCGSEHEEMREISAAVREEGRRVPPAPAWPAVEARLRRAGQDETTDLSAALPASSGRPRSQPWLRAGVLQVAAVFVAGIGLGALLYHYTAGRGEAPEERRAAGDLLGAPLVSGPPEPSPVELALVAATRRAGPASTSPLDEELPPARWEEIPVEHAALRAGFRPVIPAELPGGFRLARCRLMSTSTCRALRLSYQRGGEVIEVLQQPASVPVDWQPTLLQSCVLSGQRCRRSTVCGVEVVQLAAEDLNFLVVAPDSVSVSSIVGAVIDEGARSSLN